VVWGVVLCCDCHLYCGLEILVAGEFHLLPLVQPTRVVWLSSVACMSQNTCKIMLPVETILIRYCYGL
jgi:hypothetical protein